MRFTASLAILLTCALLNLACSRMPAEEHPLTLGWQFKHPDSSTWMSARVPGCIHLDLMGNGMIEDPYYGDHEKRLQWVGESDWEYQVFFDGGDFSDHDRVELVFEGLDTYAAVYLNDSLLLMSDNMFRTWEADIKNKLRRGENRLSIRFFAPEKIEREKSGITSYVLPDLRGYTRKAPYQYGWDWGPKLVTAGIWKPVFIRTWDGARIGDVQILLKEIDDSYARFMIVSDVHSSQETKAELQITVNDEKTGPVKREVTLEEGLNQVTAEMVIPDPELWWPAGMGDQPLYTFTFELTTPGSFDRKSIRTGIREVELVQERDSIGESFYFRVNGLPVFMKGANYIPMDNFPSRVSSSRYEETLQSAREAHMNMLRVWGGGIYENDLFYDLCDELGILVWQDFMFACTMYPGDTDFLENVKQEAIQQVKRLRNHPSVALWCGNNEVDEGWHNWGWQKSLGYSIEDSALIWNHYLRLFEGILPQTVATYSPNSPYIPSSPRIGWGHEEALREGDMHYWGVWWGEEPFDVYEKKVGRFMSEFGFQGFPDMRTLEAVLDPSDKNLESEALKSHQKHPRGMELIYTYMAREYPVPDDFDQYLYISQLLQAYGMKTALEAHRRAKPRCMGTLYWQLNDCWPVISWSGLDYFNRWKALHYFARKAFDDYLVSFENTNDRLAVYVISDKLYQTEAVIELILMDFEGNIRSRDNLEITIPAGSSGIYFRKAFDGFDRTTHLLRAVLTSGKDKLAENIYYFVPVKQMKLHQASIMKEIIPAEDGLRIRLTSSHLAKNVFLSCDAEGFFSDNYFDLLPGEPYEIIFSSPSGEVNPGEKVYLMQVADVEF